MTSQDCIPWHKSHDTNGYGHQWKDGKLQRAHRVAWAEANGPIPEGMHVLHNCDNPSCVNPVHLRLGTHAENMRDLAKRMRGRRGVDHVNSVLTDDLVREIRQRHSEGDSQRSIAKSLGVSHTAIRRIINRVTWRHVD